MPCAFGAKCGFSASKCRELFMVDTLLMFNMKLIEFRPLGWVAVHWHFLLFARLALCALQCAKNSVGSGGKVMLA
jgi:hypothetical protein